MGANTSLVELFFLEEEPSLFVSGSLLVHSLPLPLVYSARECAGPTAHGSDDDEVAERF